MIVERLGTAFVIERILDAPPARVSAAFTDTRHMARWWGPKGMTLIAQTMDPRPGGLYHYGLRAPDGSEMWGRFVWREIAAPDRLVYVNSFSDRHGGLARHTGHAEWPLEMLTTVTFAAQPDGGTRLRVDFRPLNATVSEQAVFDAGHASMRQGWGGTLDQLADYLAQPADHDA